MNNKVRNALYSIKGFLKNPHIPIPYKRMLFSAIVIGQVSYYAPLLGSNKDRMRRTQTLVNSRLYWIEGFSKGNSFTSLYCVSKELNVPPLSAKCAIVVIEKIVILDWNIYFLNAIFSVNFERNILRILKFFMKYFILFLNIVQYLIVM